jgi:hypothetical protein
MTEDRFLQHLAVLRQNSLHFRRIDEGRKESKEKYMKSTSNSGKKQGGDILEARLVFDVPLHVLKAGCYHNTPTSERFKAEM